MTSKVSRWIALAWTMLFWGAVHAGTVTYVYTDPQGTPLAEADASGTITATFDYKPYGSQVLGSPKAGPGYTGHVNDPDTGFVYMQARYYDATAGRFVSLDPVEASPGNVFHFNRFAYAGNNPATHIDPDGRDDTCMGNMECQTRSGNGSYLGNREVNTSAQKEAEGALTKVNASHPNGLPEDQLAKAWGKAVAPITAKWRVEIGSKIFLVQGGLYKFGAPISTGVICNGQNQCSVNINLAPNIDGVFAGFIHSHPDFNGLSSNDLGVLSDMYGRSDSMRGSAEVYAVDPSGGVTKWSTTSERRLSSAKWQDYLIFQENVP